MSDARRVETDTRDDRNSVMRALADTTGMATPERAEFWLHGIAWGKYRGRHDTWTAARDRAAKEAGIPSSIAKRIWQRWQEMNDVGGDALLKLMLAYEELCERNETAAAAYRAQRLSMRDPHAADHKRALEGVGMGSARD